MWMHDKPLECQMDETNQFTRKSKNDIPVFLTISRQSFGQYRYKTMLHVLWCLVLSNLSAKTNALGDCCERFKEWFVCRWSNNTVSGKSFYSRNQTSCLQLPALQICVVLFWWWGEGGSRFWTTTAVNLLPHTGLDLLFVINGDESQTPKNRSDFLQYSTIGRWEEQSFSRRKKD